MSKLEVILPGGGEVVGDSLERRVEILAEDDALHATWSRFSAGRDGADLHIHREHTDFFYVLEGELTVMLGPHGDEAEASAGHLVQAPPLVVHGFRNAADVEVRYLNFHAPGHGFADFMRGIRDGRAVEWDSDSPPDDGGRPASDAAIGGGGGATDHSGWREQVLADIPAIMISEVNADPGATTVEAAGAGQSWLYVLEGELLLSVDGEEAHARAGSWVSAEYQRSLTVFVGAPDPGRYVHLRA